MEQNEIPQTGVQEGAKPVEAIPADLTMEQLLNQGDLNLDMPKPGDARTGMIASISDEEVLVSIGAKSEGVIPARELQAMSPEERANLKVGQEIQVYIVGSEGNKGTVQLSYTRSMEDDDWSKAEALLESKEAYQGKIEGFNKGGLIVGVGRLRAFVPASQVSQTRRMRYNGDTPEQRWSEMIGESLVARVIEVDRERRRLILSERAAAQESREALKERLLSEIKVGDVRKGRITSLADFGAFVNINGADGLVHLSELSWERVDHPNKMLSVGDEVEVKVISIDTERRRIGLSMRQLQKDPWEDSVEDYHVGQLVEGTITRLVKFGAFARIDDHVEGLIHISELSENRIEHPKEVVKEGDKLALRVIKIEPDRRRIGLSLRKVDSAQYSDQDYEAAMAAAGELNGSQKTAEPAGETSAPEETSPEDPSQPFGETITVEAKAVANAPEEPEAPASIGEEEK
ncbi:MAG TPA: S1 RNA-binding domain-containing protein [Anaerolineales bacterium]|nr:S1 RNA-binding domain-containing protein [Anaerolineales bacterium]